MVPENNQSRKFDNLRKRAQAFIAQQSTSTVDMSQEDVLSLIHALDTYHIELELQNEDMRQAQANLAKSRKKFSDLYDFAPIGYLTVNENGLIGECNLRAADMFGEERGHLLNQPISRFILHEDQDIFYTHRRKLLEEQGVHVCELRIKTKQNVSFYTQLESTVSANVDGDTGQFRICITDISERKEFENVLRRSKQEWEKSFDAIDDIVTIQDTDMNIIRANKAAHAFFNAKPGELNGRKCYEFFRGVSTPCQGCPEPASLSDKESHTSEIKHEKLDKIFQVSTSPILDNGIINNIVHVAKDITEKKKLEETLFQSRKMEAIGTLAGGIAHDFNNILAAILGFANLVKEEAPKGSVIAEDVEQIIISGQRAVDLVRQILTLSRKADHTIKPFEPYPIVKEALEMLRATIPSSITIIESIDVENAMVLADPTKMHQIVVNLCTNAYHAMENEKGTLYVNLKCIELEAPDKADENIQPGPYIVLEIRDTGHGIDKETIGKIFEPYFTTKEVSNGSGAGLGLAVTNGAVKDFNGFIEVESEVGTGTTFRVYLPAIENKSPSAVSAPKTDLTSLMGNEKILIVDDEHSIVHLQKRLLERLGYTVDGTTSSIDGLEKIRTDPEYFDLVITDQTMPLLPGFEFAQEIFRINPKMPVILCTGYSSIVSEEEALAIGIKKYAAKPLDFINFCQIIRDVFDELE